MIKQLNIPTIQTSRLVLEPLSMKHSSGMFTLWSDAAVCKYSGIVHDGDGNVISTPVAAPVDSDLIIDFWLKAAADGWGFRWAVVRPGRQGAFVGTLGFNSLSEYAEIAFHLSPVYWRKGIMTEACRVAMDWLRAQSIACLEAFVDPENKSSIALLQRLGMEATEGQLDGSRRYRRIL